MVKCSKADVRRLKTALRWKLSAAQRQRIQMVLLGESGMAQPVIAAAMGVPLSTVNRALMALTQWHQGAQAASQASPSASRSPFAKPKGRTYGSQKRPRHPGDIIPEWWATSSGIRSHPVIHTWSYKLAEAA